MYSKSGKWPWGRWKWLHIHRMSIQLWMLWRLSVIDDDLFILLESWNTILVVFQGLICYWVLQISQLDHASTFNDTVVQNIVYLFCKYWWKFKAVNVHTKSRRPITSVTINRLIPRRHRLVFLKHIEFFTTVTNIGDVCM